MPDEDAPIRVLIVDDHRMVAEGLASSLREDPAIDVVGLAGTAAEADEMARLHRPDVVLMDFGLPDGDGAQAARKIREHRPETKVVMVTSFVDDAILLAAIDAGCSGFIPKQKPSAEVLAAVKAAHEGEALISPSMLVRLLPRLRRSAPGTPAPTLSARELEVLRLMAEGVGNKEIAKRLFVSVNTVRNHVQGILEKLEAHSKLEAVAVATRQGIIGRG